MKNFEDLLNKAKEAMEAQLQQMKELDESIKTKAQEIEDMETQLGLYEVMTANLKNQLKEEKEALHTLLDQASKMKSNKISNLFKEHDKVDEAKRKALKEELISLQNEVLRLTAKTDRSEEDEARIKQINIRVKEIAKEI